MTQGETHGVDLDLMLFSARKDKERKLLLISAVVYLIFIALTINYCLFSSFITTGDQYWLNRGLKFEVLHRESPVDHILKNFEGVGQVSEYVNWIQYVLTFIWTDTNLATEASIKPEETRYMSIHNKLMGSLRIRQIRVANDSCVNMLPKYGVSFPSQDFPIVCSDEFRSGALSMQPFGTINQFLYQDCISSGGGYEYTGIVTSYPCGGHSIQIPFSASYQDAFSTVQALQTDYYQDTQTRLIIAEYFVYNPNLNYFVSIKNAVEFTAGGAIVPSWQFIVFKLEVLRTVGDYISFAFCLIIPLYLCFYIYEWIFGAYLAYQDLKKQGRVLVGRFPIMYFLDLWNMIDFVKICLFAATFTSRLLWWTHPARATFLITDSKYPNLDEVAYLWMVDTYICGILAGVVIIRAFKYFELSEDNNLLIRTIYLGFWKLIGTGFVLFYVLMSFAWAYWMLYGMQIEMFRDFGITLISMFRGLTGDIPYEDLKWANRGWAPVIHSLFLIMSVFVILNMFLAVIKDIFSTVTEEESIGEEPLVVELFNLGVDKTKKGYQRIKNSFVYEDQENATQCKSLPSEHMIDQGDTKIIKQLTKFQEDHEGEDITHLHLKRALGKYASEGLVDRVTKRLDKKGVGVIDVLELSEELFKEQHTEIDGESKKTIQEALEFEKFSQNIKKGESLKSIGIEYEQDDELEEDEMSRKIDALMKQFAKIQTLINK